MKRKLFASLDGLCSSKLGKSAFLVLALQFSLLLFVNESAQGQCNYLYQGFESFRSSVVVTGSTSTTPVPISGYNSGILGFGVGASTSSYSGSRALVFSNAAGYIITPKISSITNQGTIRVSFMVRLAAANATPGTLAVATSSDYSGSGIMTGATWTPLTMSVGAISLTTTSWVYCSVDITPGSAGVYLRISRTNASGGVPVIDDLAWYSNIAAENSLIVMPTNNTYATTIGGAATSCYSTASRSISFAVNPLNFPTYSSPNTTNLASGVTYYLYDNGGNSDTTAGVAGSDSFNLNQNNTVVFTPAGGDRIEFNNTLITSGSGTATGALTLTRPSGTILSSTTALGTATNYAGNYCENSTLNYTTSTSGTITSGWGLYTEIKSNPPASCANVTGLSVTSGNVTFDTIPLTWNQITGCSVPGSGYDYYVSDTNVAPPTGALTPSSTTSLQAGNVSNGSSTGVSVSGLSSNTPYYIWVRTNCGSGSYGAWVSAATTTTLCSPVGLPYTEDFQSSGSFPTCMATNNAPNVTMVTGANNYIGVAGVNTLVISKPLTLTSGVIYRFSFDFGNSLSQSTIVQAFYGRTNFNVLSNLPSSSLGTYTTSSNTFSTTRTYFQPSSSGTYYVSIRINSIAGGALILDNLKVEVVPCFPAATPTITGGPTSSCPGTTVTYTATATGFAGNTTSDGLANATTTATSLTWTVPSGWLVLSQPTTLTASVQTGIIPGNVSASGNLSGCDSSPFTNYAVTSNSIPAQPSAISGLTSICTALPTTSLVYSVTNAASSYNWVFPAGWTITAGAGTNSVTVTATASAVTGTITVTPSNGSCTGTPRTLNVVVGTVSNPTCDLSSVITTSATDTFRCSTRNFWYKFTAICSGSHKVNLNGNGGDIDLYVYTGCSGGTGSGLLSSGISSSATESVTVTFTAGVDYYIRVFEYVTPAGTGGTFTVSVTSQSIGTLGAITGTSSVSCSSVTTTTYSVASIAGASTYTWTVPAGWTINSGQGTTSISVTSNGTTGGVITVTPSGVCGIGLPVTKTISVGQIQPDTITGSTTLCSPFSPTTYSITPVLGATSYVWTLPSGWTGSSTSTSITATPSSNNGNVTVAAVGPCGSSAATTLAVITAAPVVTSNASVCQGGTASMTSTVSPLTYFTMSNIPATGAPTFVRSEGTSTPPYINSFTTVSYTTTIISPTVSGTYVFNGCASGDTFLHIYDGGAGAFNPSSPATNFLAANDDGNNLTCSLDPRITIDLVAGNSYTLVYSTYSSTSTAVTGIGITVTPPPGGGVQFGTTDWYTTPTGGTPIFSNNSFNPVGVSGSGLTDTNTVGVTTYYATNSLSSFCRTPTTFSVVAKPTVTITNSNATICSNSIIAVSVTGTATSYSWSSDVANTLFSNSSATIAYSGTNITTVYVKSTSTVTVTVVGSNPTGCTDTASVTFTVSPSSTKTWSGSGPWSPSAPVLGDNILITGNYPGGSITGCNCIVTGTAVFSGTDTVTLAGSLDASAGSVTFNSGSSLVQTNEVSNVGNIFYLRDSQPSFKYDYTYWSTPVASQTPLALSPNTHWSGFFDYNPSIANWQQTNASSPMTLGKGYLIRVPNSFPISPVPATVFTAQFIGVPNNGNIPLNVVHNPASQLNLIGNPYPSAISASAFVTDSANSSLLGGTLYFWTHNTNLNLSTGQYTNNDYAAWNMLGGTSATNSGSGNISAPTGSIASGQGFFAATIASGTGRFTNSMRTGGAANANANFYRAANSSSTDSEVSSSLEKHRIWLNITNNGSAFKQMLVGYIQDGTDGLDRLFDGELFDVGNEVVIYSTLQDKRLTIQGRGLTFSDSDTFDIGYKATTANTYTISLSNFDGLFTTQAIYLEDRLLNVTHNLKESAYSFSSEAGTYNDRFVLRFTNQTLGVPVFSANTVMVYKQNDALMITSGAVPMQEVTIYDITGRLLSSKKAINATQTSFVTLPTTNQVLLVQITAETGEKVLKKVQF